MEREAREAVEEATLRPGATRSQGAGDRLTKRPTRLAPALSEISDRILHAASFRRLAGKNQVFVFPDDHQRTRLTPRSRSPGRPVSHARVERAAHEAVALGTTVATGRVAALRGRAAPYVEGGFNHAVWGADVTLKPLNLCSQTLDGIRTTLVASGTADGERSSRGLTASPTCATTSRTQ